MAHRPFERRSTPANHPTFSASPSHHPRPIPDPHPSKSNPSSFMLQHFSTLGLNPKPHKRPPLVDAKSLTLTPSAVSDSSKFKPTLQKETKLHGLFKSENKDCSSRTRSVVEDVKAEKSRKHAVQVEHHRVVNKTPPPAPGGRRSFCGTQLQLLDVFAINGVKMVSADMPPFMQIHAVDCARKAFDSMEKFTSKTLAFSLKKEFDGVYGPAWHCIVGTSFGSFVTHSVGGFLYFSMDQKLYILLFKTAVQKVD